MKGEQEQAVENNEESKNIDENSTYINSNKGAQLKVDVEAFLTYESSI